MICVDYVTAILVLVCCAIFSFLLGMECARRLAEKIVKKKSKRMR
jgi:phage gp36-like protein